MKTKTLIMSLALALALAVPGLVLANSTVELPRWVLGGGASDAAGGTVTMRATLGQPVAGVVSGGDVALGQGFWGGSPPEGGHAIYLPLVLRG